jgi:hypothetical protein
MGTAILIWLPSFPFSASFLTPREKAIAQARLNRDHKPKSHGGMTGMQAFKAVVSDLHSWMFMIIYASCKSFYLYTFLGVSGVKTIFPPVNVGVATVSYFLPTLINGLGFSSINAQGLTGKRRVTSTSVSVFNHPIL